VETVGKNVKISLLGPPPNVYLRFRSKRRTVFYAQQLKRALSLGENNLLPKNEGGHAMSSASRLSYFGPEDFPSLRAFLQRSGYSLEGCEKPETRLEAAKHLCEIFSDGSHDPVQMLDMLLAIRAQRLSQSNQRELEAWENEGGYTAPQVTAKSLVLRWPPRKRLRLRLAHG
jgi:hypothetical protein